MINSVELNLWRTLLERSLVNRLQPDDFTTNANILYQRSPLSSAKICSLFLSPALQNNYCLDPKALRYTLCLLNLGFIDVPNILIALWNHSTIRAVVTGIFPGEERKQWINSFTAEETLFYRLAKAVSSGSVPKMVKEAVETISACTQWMEGVISATQPQHELPSHSHNQIAEMNAQNMALGTLIVSVVENELIQHAIARGYLGQSLRKRFGEALAGLVPLMLMRNSPQGAARIEVFRAETMPAIEPLKKTTKSSMDKEIEVIIGENLEDEMALDNITVREFPDVNTRAGLYVYLNSLLVGRPLIDDNAIFAFLQSRYRGDLQTTIIDLILASFDILANATVRNEKAQTKTLLRSFLINKLPLLLVTLSSQLFPPLTSELCITEALSHVDTTNFPTLSTMFDEASGNNMFSESVRQDFCFACCLHGLIAEASIEELLGDVPIQSLPAEGRYIKRSLVKEFLSDVEKAERMIEQLENMDGNVGAVSNAITEVISKLCSNKETMALKTLCSRLVRKPSSLDIMLLFDKPISILQPISDLLDNWRYDEDQGEYQPVYEEFGSILLLFLCFVHRYNLTPINLGPRPAESFVLKMLQTTHFSLSHLQSPSVKSHLNNWLVSLFSPENSGLTDDLMSSCPPQEFYLLTPALFQNIVLACNTQSLNASMLSSGLEYLVDTFLLPALVPGITFLSSHLWENRGDKDAVIQILTALIIAPLSNTKNADSDAIETLNVVLNITAKDLEQSLRWLQRAEPQRQDIEPLSKAIRGNLGWERCAASEHTELENWTSTPGGGLSMAIKHTFAQLLQWHLQPSDNPANYTHRQILVGIKMLGARRLIGIILQELREGIGAGHAGAALDIASAIVCAADPSTWDSNFCPASLSGNNDLALNSQRRLSLREALKIEAEYAPKLIQTDRFAAETVVILYRKVESLLAIDGIDSNNVLATAQELDAVVDMTGLAQSESGGIRSGISGLEGMDGIAALEMSHIDRFEGLGDGMGNVDGFGADSVNLMNDDGFMGVGGNRDLLDKIGF